MSHPGSNKQVFYIISQIHKSHAFEWIALRLRDKCRLTFVLLNPSGSALEDFLQEHNIKVIRLTYTKLKLPIVFFRLLWLFLRERPSVVHAHLFEATVVGLTAAWIARVRKRIYTRHNSTYHHVYYPSAVKYDRFANFLATTIISISQATDEVLIKQEGVSSSKVIKIPHGFDFNEFSKPSIDRIQKIQKKWNISSAGPRIGVVARHIEWKGIQFIIPAFREFLKRYPEASLILANASGPYHSVIVESLKDIPLKNVTIIPFEEDIVALYTLMDVYVHTPIDSTCEAFGQTYIESLASGIPSIFSLSGIAKEFIEHGKTAWVVNFKDSAGIYAGIQALWEDKELRSRLIEKGRQTVISRFEISTMIERLMQLYGK